MFGGTLNLTQSILFDCPATYTVRSAITMPTRLLLYKPLMT